MFKTEARKFMSKKKFNVKVVMIFAAAVIGMITYRILFDKFTDKDDDRD
jgi:hypothetical protein